MNTDFSRLFHKLREEVERRVDRSDLHDVFDLYREQFEGLEVKKHADYLEAKSEVEHLNACIVEIRKELTESINQKDNTDLSLGVLLSSIPNLVYFKNLDLEFLLVNHSFETWINKSVSEIKGKKDFEIYPSYLKRDVSKYEREVLETGMGIYNLEEKIDIDQSEIWLLTSISPFKDAEGELKGIITSSLDITIRKKHELELEEAHQKAQTALNVKNEFLANISHELRTPLHAIAGSAEMLQQQGVSQDARHLIQIVNQSSHDLLKQLDDLILYTQAESKKLEQQIIEFDIKQSIDDLFQKNREKVEAKGLELRWFIDENLPVELRGDKMKLILLLDTFLSNSIKFTEKGFVHLVVKECSNEENQTCIRFDLIDTGIGIAKDKQHEIFELFSTGDSSHIKRFSGTGLGLSLAKKILLLLNARYGFESKEHIGTHFWFELDFPSPAKKNKKKTIKPKDLNVLLVEDNLVNQKIAFFTLKKLGFNVDIAENGKEAVEKYKSSYYQLVLMDIQMPVMDGFDATREIRAYEESQSLEPSIIIALSANVLSRDVQNCFEVGMNEFISKPFSSDKLTDKFSLYFDLEKN
jgi:PAS domain S-box-containing protein